LNGEFFYSLKEAQIVIEQWRKHYNAVRPHSSLRYRPPAPQGIQPIHLTAGSGRANAIISLSRWYKKSVRPVVLDNAGSMANYNKIGALNTAVINLLNQLKAAAVNNGAFYVSIIPLMTNGNDDASTYNASSMDWTDWNPKNAPTV
jgi:Integrase core domain